jgi:hypothetical protein
MTKLRDTIKELKSIEEINIFIQIASQPLDIINNQKADLAKQYKVSEATFQEGLKIAYQWNKLTKNAPWRHAALGVLMLGAKISINCFVLVLTKRKAINAEQEIEALKE